MKIHSFLPQFKIISLRKTHCLVWSVRKSQIRSIVLNNEIMLRHYLSSLETSAERWWSAFHHSTTSHLHKVGNYSAFTEMAKKKGWKFPFDKIYNIIYSDVGVVIGCICRNKCKKYNLIKILSWRFSPRTQDTIINMTKCLIVGPGPAPSQFSVSPLLSWEMRNENIPTENINI